jgi:hydrogenase maturation protein HypF
MSRRTIEVTIQGLIQGVGFRPFIYRIATRNNLKGRVCNTNENVQVSLTGSDADIDRFMESLEKEAPPVARISSVTMLEVALCDPEDFRIEKSLDISDDVTDVSPDIAVCTDCLDDIKPGRRREGYAFVNCTNCGPRFTIIRDLPYDRAKTTMESFEMCTACREEYETITDRRFHAQPTACARCGPAYALHTCDGNIESRQDSVIVQAAAVIDNGGIVLLKGLGGMHLACDARNSEAVARLRELKNREEKPFAVMVRDRAWAETFAVITKAEADALGSWRRPIVLVKIRNESPNLPASGVYSRLDRVGIMLPYMPFHFQLFEKLNTPVIVLTSGNFSEEPIITGNQEALASFSGKVEAMVLHNRGIHNRTDDSVVVVSGGRERLIRRSRGYAPEPVMTNLDTEGIVAFGAELTNTFCLGKGKKAILSQYIGDLKNFDTTRFYDETLERFIRLFRLEPRLLAVDMHPDYVSTKMAEKFPGIPVVKVQHHHAHIASCMAEYGLDEEVIGVAFDGTGFGEDGHTWGSEFLVCDLTGYRRLAHFEYLPMPGGDIAGEQPWRMALAWLYKVFGDRMDSLHIPGIREIDPAKAELVLAMMRRKVNCPLTCGAGRLFDATASLLGLCQEAAFHAQGPMLLESIVTENTGSRYSWSGGGVICFDDMLRGMLGDMENRVHPGIIAAKFHNTIISVIFDTVNSISRSEGIRRVVLSGGVFQNRYLLEGTTTALMNEGLEVFTQCSVPSNDGGVALGQLAVAAKRREKRCV